MTEGLTGEIVLKYGTPGVSGCGVSVTRLEVPSRAFEELGDQEIVDRFIVPGALRALQHIRSLRGYAAPAQGWLRDA